MTAREQLIKARMGMLALAEQLQNISAACQRMPQRGPRWKVEVAAHPITTTTLGSPEEMWLTGNLFSQSTSRGC
jgi:hypothetical protein